MSKLIKFIKRNNNIDGLYGPIDVIQVNELIKLLDSFVKFYGKFWINSSYIKNNLDKKVKLVNDSFKSNKSNLRFDGYYEDHTFKVIIRNPKDGYMFSFTWYDDLEDYLFEVGNYKDNQFLINYNFNSKSNLMNSIYEVCQWILEDWGIV